MKKILSALLLLIMMSANLQEVAAYESPNQCNLVEIQMNIGNTQNVIDSLPYFDKELYTISGADNNIITFTFEEGTVTLSFVKYNIKKGNNPSTFTILIESEMENISSIDIIVSQSKGQGQGQEDKTEYREITLDKEEDFELGNKLNFITLVGCFTIDEDDGSDNDGSDNDESGDDESGDNESGDESGDDDSDDESGDDESGDNESGDNESEKEPEEEKSIDEEPIDEERIDEPEEEEPEEEPEEEEEVLIPEEEQLPEMGAGLPIAWMSLGLGSLLLTLTRKKKKE